MTFAYPKPVIHPQLSPALTYIIGEPGAGKSTLLGALVGVQPHREIAKPFAHRMYATGVFELGARRTEFGGTDALSMSVQPKVVEWLEATRPMRVIGEGDRLGNSSFLQAAEELGYAVNLYVLWGPEAAALQRRIRGTEQDPAWVDGRRSKVRNIMESRAHVMLEAGAPIQALVERIRQNGDPVLKSLRGAR